MNTHFKYTILSGAFIAVLSGCGGGSSSDTSISSGDEQPSSSSTVTTNYIANGTISGFGSVMVGGVKFDTAATDFDVDNLPATQDDLRVGMVVQVEGVLNADGKTGVANRIIFDEVLEGPISNLTANESNPDIKTFTQFGTTVQIDRNRTQFDDITFDTLANGQSIEVSGYFNADRVLLATYIDRETDTNGLQEYKLNGYVENLDLATLSFTVNGQTIQYASAQFDDDFSQTSLSNGLLIEAEGYLKSGVFIANELDLEDGIRRTIARSESDDFDIEGYIENYQSETNTFTLRGVQVDASNMNLPAGYISLENNIWVEVEGVLNRESQTLIATEIELRDSEIELEGQVVSVNLDANGVGNFVLNIVGNQVTINTGYATLFDRENSRSRELFVGEFVEIDAYQANGLNPFALEIEVDSTFNENNGFDEQEFQGIYQGAQGRQITVSSVVFTLSENARFENENLNGPRTLAEFLAYDTSTSPKLSVEIEYQNGMVTHIEIDDHD